MMTGPMFFLRDFLMSDQKAHERINDLESKLMYLQKDLEALNETVLENTLRLEKLKIAVDRLTHRLESQVAASEEEPRSLEDEKPPHY